MTCDKLKFCDYKNLYDNTCINGEIKLKNYCEKNLIQQDKLFIDFPAIAYKRTTNTEQYLHIKNSITNTTISIYDKKEDFDEIFWFIYIRTFINMIILYFVLCIIYYRYFKYKK
jgi:hypothetical protein